MNAKTVEDKLNNISILSKDIEYLRGEFNGKLWGSRSDGDVRLEQIIAFAQENEGLLEYIAKVAKQLK